LNDYYWWWIIVIFIIVLCDGVQTLLVNCDMPIIVEIVIIGWWLRWCCDGVNWIDVVYCIRIDDDWRWAVELCCVLFNIDWMTTPWRRRWSAGDDNGAYWWPVLNSYCCVGNCGIWWCLIVCVRYEYGQETLYCGDLLLLLICVCYY